MRPVRSAVVALAAVSLLAACQADPRPVPAAPAPPAPRPDVTAKDYAAPPMPRASVRWVDAFGEPLEIKVEVAATPGARERGLMWRSALPDGEGMLFLFGEPAEHTFWMKNTLIPLDLVFLSADGTVVGVVENTEPRSLVPRGVGKPSANVLEVPGGWCARHGLRAGAKLVVSGLEAIRVEQATGP
ncbi:MAG: hypothetical protein RL653_959 [Pseudomonadota bacterium]|jgi:uncharacterized membrane protein (UPF0127 family)